MEGKIKRKLTNIGKIDYFKEVIGKLTLEKPLTGKESTYILTCAIMFINAYEKDQRHTTFIELAYYLILKYSIISNDYKPLYDFAVNFGFYPIVNTIINNNLILNKGIEDVILEENVSNYKNGNIIETLEQFKTRNSILNDTSSEICYVAPTSFGKSSIIREHLKKHSPEKIGIIVPTKSLLNQTYKDIKNEKLDYRLIIHDDMYNNDKKFIGILTQERALRLLEEDSFYFDMLYVDEAHKLLTKDTRNRLLSRLINISKKKNINLKIMYLSPLISNSDNIKLSEKQTIENHKISYNVKEPELYNYSLNGEVEKYNRFINEYYPIEEHKCFYEFIKTKATEKTFIYHLQPRKIEIFAKEFSKKLPDIEETEEIKSIISILKTYVHKNFYMITFIKKGIVYLHGKLPDQVKEFLEYKYKTVPELKYLIANTVILEGVNLPISSLFVLHTDRLKITGLHNLIGRVNRLNDVFGDENQNKLKLLTPQIYFVNTQEYNIKNRDMKKRIEELRSKVFNDYVENPLLSTYDIDKLNITGDKEKTKAEKKQELLKKNAKIIDEEYNFLLEPQNENSKLKNNLLKYSVAFNYNLNDTFIETLNGRIINAKKDENWFDKHIIDKLYEVFIMDFENVVDFEIARLKNEVARKYYKNFIAHSDKSLNEKINYQYKFFKDIQNDPEDRYYYMGGSYGERKHPTKDYKYPREVYVDLKNKSDDILVNLSIVKVKMEEDFVSYSLNNYFNLMLELGLVSQNEYNLTVYGTNDEYKIKLISIGLPINVVNKLEEDNQLKNIYYDRNRNIQINEEFKSYKNTVDEFFRFKLDKFL